MSEIERAIELIRDADAFYLGDGKMTEESVESLRAVILKSLRAELEREKNPMTWSERINQMTVEEKADVAVILSKRCARALEKESCPDLTCWQCFIEFLNSPYIEGETK